MCIRDSSSSWSTVLHYSGYYYAAAPQYNGMDVSYDAWLNTNDVGFATYCFMACYERPAAWAAKTSFPNKRLPAAQSFYEQLTDCLLYTSHLMNGTQRLSVIHSLLNPYKPFYFDYQKDISAKRVQTTKDCIAPTQIDWRPDGMFNDCFKLDNGVYGQVLVMKKFGSELSDRALADIVDLPLPMAVTWFVQPMDKSKACLLYTSRCV